MKIGEKLHKTSWLSRLLDTAAAIISGSGVCLFAFINLDAGAVTRTERLIAFFLWTSVGTLFWSPILQELKFGGKVRFYIALFISSFFFVAHSNDTLESNGVLFFNDARYILPHQRPDVEDFTIVYGDAKEDTGMTAKLAFREKYLSFFDLLDSLNVSPKMVILTQNMKEIKDESGKASKISRQLASSIGRQKYPVLLRDDGIDEFDGFSRDQAFFSQVDAMIDRGEWNKQFGFLQYSSVICPSPKSNFRIVLQKIILQNGHQINLSLLAAEHLGSIIKWDTRRSKRQLMDYARKKPPVLECESILASNQEIDRLQNKIIVLGAAKDTIAVRSCIFGSSPLTQAEAFVNSAAVLRLSYPIRDMNELMIFIIYIFVISLNLQIYARHRNILGLDMAVLFLLGFFCLHFIALLFFALLNIWTGYHYLFLAYFVSFIIYRIGEWKNAKAA